MGNYITSLGQVAIYKYRLTEHQGYIAGVTQSVQYLQHREVLKKYKQPRDYAAIFFFFQSSFRHRETAEYQIHQQSTPERRCSKSLLQRCGSLWGKTIPVPFLARDKTRPHGTWLATTKCDLVGQHEKRDKWFSLKAHYIKYIVWDHLETSIRHTNTVTYST